MKYLLALNETQNHATKKKKFVKQNQNEMIKNQKWSPYDEFRNSVKKSIDHKISTDVILNS